MTDQIPPRNRAERRAAARRDRRTAATVLTASKIGAVVATTAAAAFVAGDAPAAAAPQTFTVTTLNPTGAGSLSDAIDQANANAGEDTINFQTGLSGTITLTADLPKITDALDIVGPGASAITVDGANQFALLNFYAIPSSAGSNSVSGLTLTHGLPNNKDSSGGGIVSREGSSNLTISNMVITDNHAPNNDAGGVQFYDASGDMTITGTTISNNTAGDGGGGALYADAYNGTLNITIENSTITGNSAYSDGGALYFDGQGDPVNVTISNTTISGNTAGDDGGGIYSDGANVTIDGSHVDSNGTPNEGGGIYGDEGSLTLSDSTVSGNHSANDSGGGLHLYSVSPTITASTISGNTSGRGGGGVFVTDDGSNSTLTMRNSTLSGNTTKYYGGGLYVAISGVTTIQNSTISGNTGSQAGGIYGSGGGLALTQVTVSNNTATKPSSGTAVGGIQLTGQQLIEGARAKQSHASSEAAPSHNNDHKASPHAAHVHSQANAAAANPDIDSVGTIIAGNAGEDVGVYNTTGTMTSDHSVLGTVDSGVTVTDAGGTQSNVTDPGLGPLADNGGPTQTQALLAGSPAIDKGPVPEPTFPGSDFDQRGTGFDRVINGVVDVGAYEVQPEAPVPAPLVITPKFTG
jgi:predicted outer membrane repeat protein